MTDRTRSDAHTHAEGGTASSHMHLRSGPDLEESGGGSAGLLGGLAGRARNSLSGRLPNPDLLEAVRSRPLTAVGLLFSAGFLLAVTTGSGRRPAFLDRARSRVRTVLLTGLTAAVAQELRSIVSEEDLSELLSAWTGHDDDEEFGSLYEEDDEEDEF